MSLAFDMAIADIVDDTIILDDEDVAAQGEAVNFFDEVQTLADDGDATMEEIQQHLNNADLAETFLHTTDVFGYNPANLILLNAGLQGTSISTPGLEQFITPMLAVDRGWIVAREGIIGSITETIGGWIKKAWSLVTGLIGKILSIVATVVKKITGLIAKLVSFPFKLIGGVIEQIKAHPMATLTLAASCVMSVPALVGMVCKIPIPQAANVIRIWIGQVGKLVSNSAFGRFFSAKFTEAGLKLNKMIPTAKVGTPSRLGLAGDKVRELLVKMQGTFKEGGAITGAIAQIKTWASSAFKFVKGKDQSIMNYVGTRKSVIGKTLGFFWKMFRDGFVTPIGLFFTTVMQIFSSVKKIKKKNAENAAATGGGDATQAPANKEAAQAEVDRAKAG